MILARLTWFYDFIHVLYSTRKHHTKNEYFSKHVLFSTIYSLQEQKLNPRSYSKQGINMIFLYKINNMTCFVCKVSMHEHAWSFVNKYINFCFIGIL
jgi:hypothetical protein